MSELEEWRSRPGETMGQAFERAKTERDALVAEVRRLRARFRLCRDCESTLAKCELAADVGAVKCCPDCRHDGP